MDNFKLNGIGKFNGGEFYDVTINGIGTLNGDLNSENLIINGMFTSKGEIKVKNKIDINGSSKFEKTVKKPSKNYDSNFVQIDKSQIITRKKPLFILVC